LQIWDEDTRYYTIQRQLLIEEFLVLPRIFPHPTWLNFQINKIENPSKDFGLTMVPYPDLINVTFMDDFLYENKISAVKSLFLPYYVLHMFSKLSNISADHCTLICILNV